MSERRFLATVSRRLRADGVTVSPRRATEAVFESLHQRLTFGQTVDVEEYLPEGIEALWRLPGIERVGRFMGGVIPVDRDEFLERVRVRAELDNLGEARIAASAVFRALKRQLPRSEQKTVGERLPVGLRELWDEA